MAKKKFDFTENKKSVDELFEEQFKQKEAESSSSALPPDIPISLKDINKIVNADAQNDEGMLQEEVREQVIDIEDEEGAYDLEEMNEESVDEIEEELDELDSKKKKRKKDREKGRKNEKAYQEQTKKLDEATRLHNEEMQKQYERMHQQEELSASEKRNRELVDDDFEINKKQQAEAQQEKIDNVIAAHRQKEEEAKNYQGFENKNIDFSGKNEHGKQEEYQAETEKPEQNNQASPFYEEQYQKDPQIKREDQDIEQKVYKNEEKSYKESQKYSHEESDYKENQIHGYNDDFYKESQSAAINKDNYKEPVTAGPVDINKESESKDSYHQYEDSLSRKIEKEYIDEDREKAAKAESEARKEYFRDHSQAAEQQNNYHDKDNSEVKADYYKSEKHTEDYYKPGDNYKEKSVKADLETKQGYFKEYGQAEHKADNPPSSRVDYKEDRDSKFSHSEEVKDQNHFRNPETAFKEEKTNPYRNDGVMNFKNESRTDAEAQRPERNQHLQNDNFGKDYHVEESRGSELRSGSGQHFIDSASKNSETKLHYGYDRDKKSDKPTENSQSHSSLKYERNINPKYYHEAKAYHLGTGKNLGGDGNAIQANYGKANTTNSNIVSTVIGSGSDIRRSEETVRPVNNDHYSKNVIDSTKDKNPYTRDYRRKSSIDERTINNGFGSKQESKFTSKQENGLTGKQESKFTSRSGNDTYQNNAIILNLNKAYGSKVNNATNMQSIILNLEKQHSVNIIRTNETSNKKYGSIINNVKSGKAHKGIFDTDKIKDKIKPTIFTLKYKLNPIKLKSNLNEIIINEKGVLISRQEVKFKYAKTMGSGFYRAGNTVLRGIGNQIENALRENDTIDTALKVKTIGAGLTGSISFLRMQRNNVGVAGNFLKAKGNAVLNAGRYFKGQETKQLKLVPRTAKQYDAVLKLDKDLIKLKDSKLIDMKNKLNKLKKSGKITKSESILLARIENHLNLRTNKKILLKDKRNVRKLKNIINILASSVLASGDLSAQSISMGLTTLRYFKKTYRVSKTVGRLGIKATGMVFRPVAKVGIKTAKAINKIPIVNKKTTIIRTRVANSKTIRTLNKSANKVIKIRKGVINELHGGIYSRVSSALSKRAPSKLKNAAKTIGNGAKKVGKGVSTVKKGVNKVTKVISTPFRVIASPFRAISAALSWIKGKIIAVVAIFLLIYCGIMMLFSTGILTTSMIFTDTDNLQKYVDSLNEKKSSWMSIIQGYQNQGGKKHGKYKEVTVNYVDENGNTLAEIGNMKEILSMVAVHIENDWPDWYEFIDSSKVDSLAKQLFDDSHDIETTEIGPYSCDGCEERDYKCTDALPDDASSERIGLHDLYADRGGCIQYNQTVTYYCSNDTVIAGGETFSNAHNLSWANTFMKNQYNNWNYKGGCQKKHSTSNDSPAAGCNNYTTQSYVKSYISYSSSSSLPKSDVTFTWNSITARYETVINTTTISLSKAYCGEQITYKWNSSENRHELLGTKYICQEYECAGHSTTVTRYRCDGHTEIYCPGDHYNLIVNAIVLHLPELYEADSKSLGVVEDIPEDASEDDFYWDNSNREWCENILQQDWNSIYEGLVGLEQSSVSGEPLTIEEIEKYLGDISELDLSENRLRVLETALSAVGKIPYYWGGYATCPGLEGNNFGAVVAPDSSGRNLKGLDCSHFVDWVCWTALGDNLGNSWTGAIWDQSTGISASQLKPGDIGFQNEGGNSVNHVGFYLGNGLWVHCSAGGNNVVVNSTSVFTYYRRLNIVGN